MKERIYLKADRIKVNKFQERIHENNCKHTTSENFNQYLFDE